MPMKDRTKLMFADELEVMLSEMPLSKVRVTELCRRCGATTPTFYYYFHDKYELVAWVYLRDFASVVGGGAEYTPEVLDAMNVRYEERRTFYQRCFEDGSQNSIERYMREFALQISIDAYSHANGGAVLMGEQLWAVRYHIHGIVGMFIDWLFGRTDMTGAQMSVLLFERTPDFLKEAFSEYPYSTEDLLSRAVKQTRITS